MASRIRTALLTTAVASGLLLTSAPAHAQPVTEDSTTQAAASEVPAGKDQTAEVPPVLAVVEPPASVTSPDAGVEQPQAPVNMPETDAVGVPVKEAAPTETGTSGTLESENNTSPSESGAENSPEKSNASSIPAWSAPNTDTGTQGPATESGATDTGTGAAAGQGTTDSGTQLFGNETTSGEAHSTEEAVETDSAPTSAPADETSITELDSFEDFVNGIEMPKGSESWTEGQWNDFLGTQEGEDFTDFVMEGLLETAAFKTILDIVSDFLDSGDLAYLDELMDYLLELFDGNAEWAQEVFDGIILGLMEGGALEEGIEVVPTPNVSPNAPVEKPKPEIKPAVNNKPVLDKKPIVNAVVKPVVQVKTAQLAETGSNGMLILGGSGLLLVLGGAVTLGLRRKQRAH